MECLFIHLQGGYFNPSSLKCNGVFPKIFFIKQSDIFNYICMVDIHVLTNRLKGYVWYGCLSYPFFFNAKWYNLINGI